MTSTTDSRRPITDLKAWLESLPGGDIPHTLRVLGELLLGVTDQQREESALRFTLRVLGVTGFNEIIEEGRDLNGVQALTFGRALGELIEKHQAECGPGEHVDAPSWTQTKVGSSVFRHPALLRAGFPAGTLLDVPCVAQIRTKASYAYPPEITIHTRSEDQAGAREVLDRIQARADELNPYRGKVVRASYAGNLQLTVIDLPTSLSRETVIVDPLVWKEIDLGVSAVKDQCELLNRHGLGSRRGVLLVGPPGTGKSAVSAVIARELVADGFTAIYVEAKAGSQLLTAVVETAQKLGGPVLLILEDIDLFVHQRGRGDTRALSEMLQAMDIATDAPILTLASTNDATTLDAAAVRAGRFDSVVEAGYPTRGAAASILAVLIDGIPGSSNVDCAAVAARLPEKTSGADVREIVRRGVLTTKGGELSTAALLAEIGSGRYRAEMPGDGRYL
ncbi:cell division protein [Mycolicibacter virginiensis]|uniref:Cell division protein n=1 Tax=Mycolicibacter virginiensis TaxID=1795032 RepID=A0A9X7P039_9MYCO|nr:ATP-binding protein [Mycolicibacter virginiensis]PQM53710.1 cell division protein [Mycolicibacter virginiensis]